MERRNFIAGALGTAAVIALPVGHSSGDCLAAQRSLNTFSGDDTLAERVDKLNALMGTTFVLHLDSLPKGVEADVKLAAEYKDTFMDYPSTSVYDDDINEGGMGDKGWRVSLWQNGKRFTGCMGLKVMFHWTAQVALGYRIAKGQVV